MATYTKRLLSGSTQGKAVKVAATSTPGTTIHTAVAGTTDFDEIWIYAANESASEVVLTLEWGGTTDVDNTITVSVPGDSGLQLIVPGMLLQNELVVKAFAATTNVITLNGFVNRIAN